MEFPPSDDPLQLGPEEGGLVETNLQNDPRGPLPYSLNRHHSAGLLLIKKTQFTKYGLMSEVEILV